MKVFVKLFLTFFKTGLFTFGGGYAMLPILQHELVDKQKWLSHDELINYFSLGQCTSGIIAVNVATFCGYKLKKTTGAIVATMALVLPSLLIIMMIASVFFKFADYECVKHILNGIRIGVAALLFKVVYDLCMKIYQGNKNKVLPCGIFALAAIGLIFLKLSAVFVVLLTLLLAVLIFFIQRRQK